jgi:flagellar biosynthesis protein FliQ
MEQVNVMLEPLRLFLAQATQFVPKLAVAILILVAGWLLAKLARLALQKGLKAINFHVLTERAGIDGFLRQGGIMTDTNGILAALVYWLGILAALMIAFNVLDLANVTQMIGQVALFVPKIIVALLVLVFGAYFARFIDQTITAYGRNMALADAAILGHLARYAIMVLVVLIALEQVQIVSELLRQSFLIILAGVVLALSLAFGLGGRKWAENLLERWWPTLGSRNKDMAAGAGR